MNRKKKLEEEISLFKFQKKKALDLYLEFNTKNPYPPLFKFPNGSSKYNILYKKFFTVRDAIGDLNEITTFGEEVPYNLNNLKNDYLKLLRKNVKEKKIYNFKPRDMVKRDKEIFQECTRHKSQ